MNFLDHLPALSVAIPLIGAFLTPLFDKINEKLRDVFVIIVASLTCSTVFLLANKVFTEGIQIYVFGANTQETLNSIANGTPLVRILFEVDGLSALMAIVCGLLTFIAVVYSLAFVKEYTGLDRYYTLLLLMTTGAIGMVLTGDMFNFFVFLEITSISSAALVAFYTNKGNAVSAAFKYIVISSIGALFVLFAIAFLYAQYDALNIAVLAKNIKYTYLDKVALVLLLAALGMKAALAPMHMWLPDAYTWMPSSATVLLVGTTQASLYGILRVCFTLYGNSLIKDNPLKQIGTLDINLNIIIAIILILIGLITICIGILMALKQSDIRRTIAYAAIAEIGYIVLAFGAAISFINDKITQSAMIGGMFHIINDALDIGLLFLVAGAIYYATKETSLNELGGLARNMKYTTVFFLIGLLAISGIPPMNGFASKIIIYESTYHINPILSIVAILCSILILAIFVKIFYSVFLGPKNNNLDSVKEVPKTMICAMVLVATIIIIFGLFPNLVIDNIVKPAVNDLINSSKYISAVFGGA